MCISPIVLKTGQMVPCGKCFQCRRKRLSEWACKGWCELQSSVCSFFITLTYSDEYLPEFGVLKKRDFQLFMKRLRKDLSKEGISVRFLGCGEYGGQTHRPHYHAVIFLNKEIENGEFKNRVSRNWSKGFIACVEANYKTIRYVCKYAAKDEGDYEGFNFRTGELVPQFILYSRRPGLGSEYFSANELQLLYDGFVSVEKPSTRRGQQRDGIKYAIPRLFRKKMSDKGIIRYADDYILVHNDLVSFDPDASLASKLHCISTIAGLSRNSAKKRGNYDVVELSRIRHDFDTSRQRAINTRRALENKGKCFKFIDNDKGVYVNGFLNMHRLLSLPYFVINKNFIKKCQ